MTNYPILSILIFLPLAGCFFLLPVWNKPQLLRPMALAVALTELLLASVMFFTAPTAPTVSTPLPGFFLYEDHSWIAQFGVRYTLGMDGISLLMAMLTAFVILVSILVSWRAVTERVALFHALLLIMEGSIMGVFLSLDLILFYLFWEVMLIPMLLLIGVWGHGRKVYSAVKFFIYTTAGSLLMLLAIIGIYLVHEGQTGVGTFSVPMLVKTQLSPQTGLLLFAAFLIAFAIKIPLFPVHTWLPDAHTDAPTAGSVILAGLLLKTGAYALIRIGYPLFPAAARSLTPLLFVLAVIGIIYGSWIAYAQKDMKRLVAYSSVGHMGFVALGIAAWTPVALSGAVLQMVNHGITTGALFVLVGMLDERCGTRDIDAFGGLWGKTPKFSFFFLLFAMASAGLPGLNNFVGELMILIGTFKVAPLAVIPAFLGIILSLIYSVWIVQKVLFGKERTPMELPDISLREGVILVSLALICILLGVHPSPLLDHLKLPVALLTGGTP
ncbi:MAG: NADH-quinone oxidoreductase subunit M [Geobacter sp.]|nr:NADH-quinone oxidoreductase subunit M [Geobacter sp.]